MTAKEKIISIILGLVLLAGAMWLARRIFIAGKGGAAQPQLSPVSGKARQAEINSFVAAALKKQSQNDQDLDGLSDTDEIQTYHTDPKKADTDGDGVLDRDELLLYKINPLKRDTYGTGHSDGWGVRNQVILPGGKIDQQKLKKLTT